MENIGICREEQLFWLEFLKLFSVYEPTLAKWMAHPHPLVIIKIIITIVVKPQKVED